MNRRAASRWRGRSVPGQGRRVGIYLLGEKLSGGLDELDKLFWTATKGEDYAAGASPLVVKARPEISRQELIARLRELVEALEGCGFFQAVAPEVPRAASR